MRLSTNSWKKAQIFSENSNPHDVNHPTLIVVNWTNVGSVLQSRKCPDMEFSTQYAHLFGPIFLFYLNQSTVTNPNMT